MSTKVKFITSIYSDLYGTEYGGRMNRGGHYSYSLLSLLKMTDADFLCYTSDRELEPLKQFFYETHSISPEKLEFKVFEDLVIKGATVVKAGTTVNAYIESVEKSRALGKEGYIRLQFVNTMGVDGTLIPIRAINSSISGENTTNTTIVLSALINPLFLFKNGKQAKLKEGKVMFVYITKDLIITVN